MFVKTPTLNKTVILYCKRMVSIDWKIDNDAFYIYPTLLLCFVKQAFSCHKPQRKMVCQYFKQPQQHCIVNCCVHRAKQY